MVRGGGLFMGFMSFFALVVFIVVMSSPHDVNENKKGKEKIKKTIEKSIKDRIRTCRNLGYKKVKIKKKSITCELSE